MAREVSVPRNEKFDGRAAIREAFANAEWIDWNKASSNAPPARRRQSPQTPNSKVSEMSELSDLSPVSDLSTPCVSMAGLTEFEIDAFEERAAILQFDAGLTREDAERQAWELIFWSHQSAHH